MANQLSEKEIDKQVRDYIENRKAELQEIVEIPDVLGVKTIRKLRIGKEDCKPLAKRWDDTQKRRIGAENQYRALVKEAFENGISPDEIRGDAALYEALMLKAEEDSLLKLLNTLLPTIPINKWVMSLVGIGPAHAASLYGFIDIYKAPSAGHILSLAGITGQDRGVRYSRALKSRLYLIADNFIKASNRDGDYYGHLFKDAMKMYQERNERGDYAELCAENVKKVEDGQMKAVAATLEKWKEGKLTDAHILARAKRYMEKIFICHYHEVAYELEFGKEAPEPYSIAWLQHNDRYLCPHKEVVGLKANYPHITPTGYVAKTFAAKDCDPVRKIEKRTSGPNL